jgi:predicted enzyme related to lactoylglutathione lyase
MIGSENVKALADFYEKVFERKPDMVEGDFKGWSVGNTFFAVGSHSEVKGQAQEPSRMLFNFETAEVKKEFERIKKAGGTVIKEPYELGGALIATIADPDGNYFQLMTPWEG